MLFEFFKFGLFLYSLKRFGVCLVNASKMVLMVPVCFVKKVYLFLSYIINLFSQTKGKRGELRYGDTLPAPKFSSLCMVLRYLSSRVLPREPIKSSHRDDNIHTVIAPSGYARSSDLRIRADKIIGRSLEFFASQKIGMTKQDVHTRTCSEYPWTHGSGPWVTESKMSLRGACLHTTWQSRQNKMISRDPHVSSLDFLRMTIKKYVQKIGMALFGVIFSLFLLFPNPSYSAICFLPDCDVELKPQNVGVDAEYCEAAGYTYSASGACPANQAQDTCIFNPNYIKCDGTEWCKNNGYTLTSCTSPKTLSTPCPSNGLLYKYCVCPSTYKYACSGTGYSSGNGTACDSKYTKCNCSSNYTWSGSACVCSSDFKYSCSGTGYSSGSGTACGGKYKSCNCSTYYSWSGSACTHTHSYVCPSGYKESNSGMISPTSTSKVCALSGCSSTSGICYKEGHSHSYSCTSGYSSSCTNGYSATASKICSCGASSGTCYKCCASNYKYSCSGTGYSSGSGTSCNSKYTACNCASGYTWNGSSCVASCSDTSCKVGHILYSDKTCCKDNLSNKTAIGIVVKDNELVMSPFTYGITWASNTSTDVSELPNFTSEADAFDDYNGKANTLAIVSAYPSDTTSNNAAKYCNSYSTAGTSAGQWYLPSAGELYSYMYGNINIWRSNANALEWSYFGLYELWSSSEYNDYGAWCMRSNEGFIQALAKWATTHSFSCFLPINVSNGVATPCGSEYQYACKGTGESGSGTACGGLYKSCNCASGYEWNGSSCTPSCSSSYKYTCSGTGYSGGSGTACDNKYTACNCATNYIWNGSACVCDSSFQYACSGVGEAGSGTSCGGKYTACVCTSNYVSFCDVTFCS